MCSDLLTASSLVANCLNLSLYNDLIMKSRIKKYFKFGAPFYRVEFLVEGSWLSLCETASDDEGLAIALQKTCQQVLASGALVWFLKDNV